MNPDLLVLTRALLNRELSKRFAAGIGLVILAAMSTAQLADRIVTGEWLPPSLASLAARGDLTIVAVAAGLMVLRAGSRVAEDHREAWLDPWVTSMTAAWQYGVAMILALVIPALLLAGAGSAVFAASLLWMGGTVELLSAWPLLMLRTTVMVLSLASCAVLVSLLVRDAGTAVVVCAGIFFGPIVLAGVLALSTGDYTVTPLIRYSMILLPQGVLPSGAGDQLITFAQAAVLGLLCAPAAMRYAGRRP